MFGAIRLMLLATMCIALTHNSAIISQGTKAAWVIKTT